MLTVDNYQSGTLGDGDIVSTLSGASFVSPDMDNAHGCAALYGGGWWYYDDDGCGSSFVVGTNRTWLSEEYPDLQLIKTVVRLRPHSGKKKCFLLYTLLNRN